MEVDRYIMRGRQANLHPDHVQAMTFRDVNRDNYLSASRGYSTGRNDKVNMSVPCIPK